MWIGPERCCSVPNNNINSNTPYQCQLPIEIPTNDNVLSSYGQTCMEFRRAMTVANNFNCSVTPQTPVSINFIIPISGVNSVQRLTIIVSIF